MIIYGSMTNTSVGKLFVAGIIPGLLLAGLFMLYHLVDSADRAGDRRARSQGAAGRAPARCCATWSRRWSSSAS